jgi:hypothetical protein
LLLTLLSLLVINGLYWPFDKMRFTNKPIIEISTIEDSLLFVYNIFGHRLDSTEQKNKIIYRIEDKNAQHFWLMGLRNSWQFGVLQYNLIAYHSTTGQKLSSPVQSWMISELVCTVGLLLDFTKSIPPWQKQCCQIAEIIKQLCLCVISYYEEKRHKQRKSSVILQI